jgi:ferritin-like metal-binding protein YciE
MFLAGSLPETATIPGPHAVAQSTVQSMKTLENLFLDTLADMYDAEQQIINALPKMAEAARSPELSGALDAHLAETEGHVQILEDVFDCFGKTPRGKKCKAAQGLLEESEKLTNDFEGSEAVDAAIICAAQKLEHYEMATYGCLHTWAELLGNEEAADLLSGILEEEIQSNAILNEIALTQSNGEALDEEDFTGEDLDELGRGSGAATSRRTDTGKLRQR